MRLHELSKELEADGKRLLDIANELGLNIKSHSSNLAKGTEGILRAAWAEELEDQARRGKRKKAAEAPATPAAGDGAVSLTIQGRPVEAAAPVESPPPAAPAVEAPSAPAPVAATAVVTAPVAPAPVPAAGSDAPPIDQDEPRDANISVTLTFGGLPATSDPEPAPEDATSAQAGRTARESASEQDKPEVEVRGVLNVPTSKARKGAKILGKIDLNAAEPPEPRTRRAAEPAFDPLDPTRIVPDRRGGSTIHKATKDVEARPRPLKPGKTGQGDFVFDPEDNSSLSAIRLGHFGNRRRPPPRRPPVRRARTGGRKPQRNEPSPTHAITVRPPIGVRELSELLGIKARELLQHFPQRFDPRDKNAVLDAEHVLELAVALGREITVLDPDTAEGRLLAAELARSEAQAGERLPRPPVVAVMGHVDHGKTTLLDFLRKTRVAAKEAGGITQVTSAYAVATPAGAMVTFLDTPGHKAFTEMRARGASVTDVALLVVAADDGVMEQTQEAIDHAKAADVPLVVAINKIDKGNANPLKVRQQLASVGVLVEDYGGEVGVIECSATTGQGMEALLERLALETEILELSADPGLPARGVVIDSRRDARLGVVATVVVQDGTLRARDAILAGTAVGRVRWLLDDRGGRIEEAGPSMPVQVVGFEDPPEAGASLLVVEDINLARTVTAERKAALVERHESAADTVTLENLFETIAARKVTEINVLLKADNMASLDVLRQTVTEVSHPEVRFKILRGGVGGVSEDDVLLASASKAFIIAFGVVADAPARAAVQQHKVEIKSYDVIYEMVDDLEKALEGQLGTETHEAVLGHATIRAVFKVSRLGNIAGCFVTDGIITRDCLVRLSRDGVLVHKGRLGSLKRFKDDVKEVRESYECGMSIANYNDIREGDVIEAYTATEVKRTFESTSKSPG